LRQALAMRANSAGARRWASSDAKANVAVRQQARTACAAALLGWLQLVITRQVSWDPVIAAGGTPPLRTVA
jgi:hypothetical protein